MIFLKKIFYFSLLAILLLNFFVCAPKIVCAQNLEVIYPPIPGSDATPPTAGTKLPDFVKYLFIFGVGLGVAISFISLIVAGVMYILSPAFPSGDFLARAKDRATGAITGLLVIILTYQILTLIYGNFALNLNELPPGSAPDNSKKDPPGLYLYRGPDCDGAKSQPATSNVIELGNDFKNRVRSAKIIQSDSSYVSLLYSNPNFRGKCQYVSPDNKCNTINLPAESASVHEYDFDQQGSGVTFFRKSFYNSGGGFFRLSKNDIGKLYIANLDQLKFIDRSCITKENPEGCCVPKDQRDCVKYEKDGSCKEWACPKLSGENISSFLTYGYYLVVLSYAGANQSCYSAMNEYCQEFPTSDEINKNGPAQIKWDQIRNNGGVVPNCVMILPIKK